MKSIFRSAAALAMATVMGAALLTGCGSTKIDGSKTVVTVNNEKVDLGVVSFYAKFTQAQVYKYYGSMMGGNNKNMFDTSYADSSDPSVNNYGEGLRKSALTEVEKMVVVSQHAKDYNISLTNDEEKKIASVAKAYIDNNSEDVRNKIGASEDDVKKLLEYQTIQSKMLDPLAKNVDTNVTQKEAQQSKVTYVSIDPNSISSNSASSSTSSSVSGNNSEKKQKAQEEAQSILSALQAEADPANADMDAIAKKVDSTLNAAVGHYTTNDTTNGSVDSAVVKAVKGLSDGTVVDHVVTGSNGSTLYVVRFDLNDDEEYTQTQKETIVRQRKQDNYDKTVDKWVKKSTIKVDSKVLNTLTINDEEPITLKDPASTASANSASANTASANSVSADSSASANAAAESGTESAASAAS